MLTCAVRGLCIVAVHAIEIVNSDVNMHIPTPRARFCFILIQLSNF